MIVSCNSRPLDRVAVEKFKEREQKRLRALREAKDAEWEMDQFFTGKEGEHKDDRLKE